MEYIFSKKGNKEILVTKESTKKLTGYIKVEQNFDNKQFVTDEFNVIKNIKSNEDESINWYLIDNHKRTIDSSPILNYMVNNFNIISNTVEENRKILRDKSMGFLGSSGRNLETTYKEEISNFDSVWHWLVNRIGSGYVSDLYVGDYVQIKLNVGDNRFMSYRIAEFYPYYGTYPGIKDDGITASSSANSAKTIAFAPSSFAPNPNDSSSWIYVKWSNSKTTNNGSSSTSIPYLESDLHKWEEETFFSWLPETLQECIVPSPGHGELRYSSSGSVTNATGDKYMAAKIWSPSEAELFGQNRLSKEIGLEKQFTLFKSRWYSGVPANNVGAWTRSLAKDSSDGIVAYFHWRNDQITTYKVTSSYTVMPCFLVGWNPLNYQ